MSPPYPPSELAYFIGFSESPGCCGFVWTQLSFCEAENGVKVSSVNKNQLGNWTASSPGRDVAFLTDKLNGMKYELSEL